MKYKASALKESKTWSIFQRFLIFKNQTFNKAINALSFTSKQPLAYKRSGIHQQQGEPRNIARV